MPLSTQWYSSLFSSTPMSAVSRQVPSPSEPLAPPALPLFTVFPPESLTAPSAGTHVSWTLEGFSGRYTAVPPETPTSLWAKTPLCSHPSLLTVGCRFGPPAGPLYALLHAHRVPSHRRLPLVLHGPEGVRHAWQEQLTSHRPAGGAPPHPTPHDGSAPLLFRRRGDRTLPSRCSLATS